MSGFVREFGGNGGTATTSITVTVPAMVPSGNSLVAAVILLDSGTAINTVQATDTKGNIWTCIHSEALTGATNTTGHLLYVVINHTLTASDSITLTFDGHYANRSAVTVAEFNDALTPDRYATGDNGGNSWSTLTTPATTPTTQANELVIGVWFMLNSGRVFTATNGYTSLTKVASMGASGNRAVVGEYKYVSSIDAYTADGTFDTSGSAIGMVQTFVVGVLPSRSGKPKVWDGSAWVEQTAYVWDGSAWVEHDAKGYNGSEWVKSK